MEKQAGTIEHRSNHCVFELALKEQPITHNLHIQMSTANEFVNAN